MEKPIQILHFDPDYKPTYFVIRKKCLIKSLIPLEIAKDLIMKDEPHLIICEPLNKAFLNQQVDPSGHKKEENNGHFFA
jgi:hypothetical protein